MIQKHIITAGKRAKDRTRRRGGKAVAENKV